MRALGACWFVQKHIGLGVVLPIHALHLKCHAIGGLDGFAVVNKLQAIAPVAFHQALLHQTCANAAGAKALGKQQVGKTDGFQTANFNWLMACCVAALARRLRTFVASPDWLAN